MNELETPLFLKFVDQQKFDKNLEVEVLYLDILYCKQYFFVRQKINEMMIFIKID